MVWDTISQFIESNMEQRKAVHIPGLGIFTFTSSKLDIGHNKFILIQRPVFVLSEKLIKTHRLTQSKYHVPGEIPVIQLNFTALAIEINVSRDLVEASVKEIVNALSRAIEKMGSCEFAFTTIGNLVISNGSARMKFLQGFLEKMDNTANLTKFLSQRPDTSSSVLSDNSILLPKIQPGDGLKMPSKSCDMAIIKELNEDSNDDNINGYEKVSSPKRDLPQSKEKQVITPTLKIEPRSPRIQQLTISPTGGEPKPVTPYQKKTPPSLKRSVTFKDPRQEIEVKQSNRVFPSPRQSQVQIMNQLKKTNKPSEDARCSSCVESMNDFCYLCFQREKRNVPIYYTEERKKEDQEEDHLLQMYTMLKDSEANKKEEDLNNKKREEAQNIARFNLGVSEVLKDKKDERVDQFQRSFVFRNRPTTPPHFIKQEDYQADLAKQVCNKSRQVSKMVKDKEFSERLEQLELAQDLAIQREHYLNSKRLQSDQYRKALDTQMSFKAPELPSSYPDSDAPVFGVHDMDENKFRDRRKRAQHLFHNQLTMASEKKKFENRRNVKLRRDEEDMLKKTRMDLLQETLVRNQLNLQQRQDLEKTWARQALKKRSREIEEKLRARSPGLLLQEQCDKYSGCGQCTRRKSNYGQSNVWSETRYVSGSRLII